MVARASSVIAVLSSLSTATSSPILAQRDPEARRWAEQNYRPEHRTDEFTRKTTVFIPFARAVDADRRTCRGVADFYVSREDSIVAITVLYTDREWLFIADGQPMLAIADTSRLALPIIGRPIRREGVSGGVAIRMLQHRITESAAYLVSVADLTTLSDAHVARLRIQGSEGRGTCEARLTERNKATITLFIERELRP